MPISSDVLVDFNPSTYVVREREEEVVLMVRRLGGSITNVTVEASTQNGTATGMYGTHDLIIRQTRRLIAVGLWQSDMLLMIL